MEVRPGGGRPWTSGQEGLGGPPGGAPFHPAAPQAGSLRRPQSPPILGAPSSPGKGPHGASALGPGGATP